MATTIKDVAKLAGVSPKTVSNVINNNHGRFSLETRDRVRAAMRALSYQPNRAAQYMRSGTIGILALAVPDIGNPYYAEIGREIIEAAGARGYTVSIVHTDGLAENERFLVSGSGAHTLDGLILQPVALTEAELHEISVITPLVTLGERATGQHYDHIMIDNIAAARRLTEHLLEQGRRRIAILPVAPDNPNSLFHMRYQGYVEALRAAGIEPDPQLAVTTHKPVIMTHHHGIECMEHLLARGSLPDAVFCLNDLVALGAMKTLMQRGYRIPQDVAVAGFDDITPSYLSSPALTTISPDKKAIGTLTVSLLIDRIKGDRTGPPELFKPDFALVVRESTVGQVTPI